MHASGSIAQRECRRRVWPSIEQQVFDVAVIGGGINGASVFHELGRRGYSAVLLEKGDFASGTSQTSAMMIWGGLLYLRHWDLRTVFRLCRARERLLKEHGDWVRPALYRYLPDSAGSQPNLLISAAMHFYWLCGGGRRQHPRREAIFPEQSFLRSERFTESFIYEDAALGHSDARFVLRWVLDGRCPTHVPLNYCALEGGEYDRSNRCWRLDVNDSLLDHSTTLRARCVVNAAGVWTDAINERFGRRTPYRHVLSKGVSIGLRRDPRLTIPLVFNTQHTRDSMVLIPWGPISLWGSTETQVNHPEAGFRVNSGDVRALLSELNRNLVVPVGPEDIVSIRSGVRPLAVHLDHESRTHTLGIARRSRIHRDEHEPWISVYGGKLTDCLTLAAEIGRLLERELGRKHRVAPSATDSPEPAFQFFPQLDTPVPTPQWCAENEMCWTLDDYLRRRTNIAQWIPRAGLGAFDEHEQALLDIATAFGDCDSAAAQLEQYKSKVREHFDKVLAGVEIGREERAAVPV